MKRPLPKSSEKRLLRVASAQADFCYSWEAYQLLRNCPDVARYPIFLAMVVAYNRPFTESDGLGSIMCEWPDFPDFSDREMSERHKRMVILRNEFLGHSSLLGTKAFLIARGGINPRTRDVSEHSDCAIMKLEFLRPEFSDWLAPLINAVLKRATEELRQVSDELASCYLDEAEVRELQTKANEFKWELKKKSNKVGDSTATRVTPPSSLR